MPDWVELSVSVAVEAADAVGHHFRELGAEGVSEEELPEGRVRVVAWLPAGEDADTLSASTSRFLESLEKIFPGSAGELPRIVPVDEQNWSETWKEGFDPVEVGERLRIRTPWTPPGPAGRIEIEILPAMAFGTGRHASTYGCLEALDALARESRGLSSTLDVGTGSGVLAFAAARLGALRVLGIDDDPVAVDAALGNRSRNRLGDVVELRTGTIADVGEERFGLVVANLFRNLLVELAAELTDVTAADAHLVVSGFLDEDAADVALAMSAAGWSATASRSREGWTTLTFRRGRGCTGS